MDNEVFINVYTTPGSLIEQKIKAIESQLKNYNFSFFNISEPPPPQKVIGSLIIIDESAIPNIQNIFKNIIDSYKYEPSFIVTSEKPNYKNAVRWMKNDAKDYIDATKDYTKEEMEKILQEALFYFFDYSDYDEEVNKNPFSIPPVKISNYSNWDKLLNDQYYDMAVIMISIILKNSIFVNYSKEKLIIILKKIEDYISNLAKSMGGKKLFWNYNNGIFIFYFGDRINSAVLSAIHILNKIKIFCIESLNLQKTVDMKITIHDGKILYSSKETKFITSDAINSVVHLQNNHKDVDSIDITENIYKYLNPRVRRFYYEDAIFEGRRIYTYYLNYFN